MIQIQMFEIKYREDMINEQGSEGVVMNRASGTEYSTRD